MAGAVSSVSWNRPAAAATLVYVPGLRNIIRLIMETRRFGSFARIALTLVAVLANQNSLRAQSQWERVFDFPCYASRMHDGGLYLTRITGGQLEHSIDLGETWHAVTFPPSNSWENQNMIVSEGIGQSAFWDESDGVASFISLKETRIVEWAEESCQMLTTNDRTSWRQSLGNITPIRAIYLFYDSVAIGLGPYSRNKPEYLPPSYIVTRDRGDSWTAHRKYPETDTFPYFASQILRVRNTLVATARETYMSMDSGASWYKSTYLDETGAPLYVSRMYAASDSLLMIVNEAGTYLSVNAGVSWTLQSRERIVNADWLSSGIGFYTSPTAIYRSDDTARSWGRVQAPAPYIHNIIAYRDTAIYAVASETQSSPRYLYRTRSLGGPLAVRRKEAERKRDIITHPNPTSGLVVIPTLSALRVYDVAGKLRSVSTKVTGDGTELDFSPLPNGVYLVVAPEGNSRVVVAR